MLSLCVSKHHCMKLRGGVEVPLHAVDGEESSASCPSHIMPKTPVSIVKGGWLGLRTGLDTGEGKTVLSPTWESNWYLGCPAWSLAVHQISYPRLIFCAQFFYQLYLHLFAYIRNELENYVHRKLQIVNIKCSEMAEEVILVSHSQKISSTENMGFMPVYLVHIMEVVEI